MTVLLILAHEVSLEYLQLPMIQSFSGGNDYNNNIFFVLTPLNPMFQLFAEVLFSDQLWQEV